MSAKDPELLFAVLLSLWRERQRLLVAHAANLLALPPSEHEPHSNTTLAELLSLEPQYVPLPADQSDAVDSQAAGGGQALHARLARLDATIAMLRGATGLPNNADAWHPAHALSVGTRASDADARDAYPSRPYLSVGARKRLRLLQRAQASSAPLPIAAYGRVAAPRLEAGETLHIPFSSGEAEACRRLVAESASGQVGIETFAAAWTRLPGREPVDCMRYWASEGASSMAARDGSTRTANKVTGNTASGGTAQDGYARTTDGGAGNAAPGESACDDASWGAFACGLPRDAERADDGFPEATPPFAQDPMLAAGLVAFRSAASATVSASASPSLHQLIRQAPLGSIGAAVAYARWGRAATVSSCTQTSLLWRGVYRSFGATSVSTRPTGSVVDIALSSHRQAPLRLLAGTNGTPHEALVYDLASGGSRVLGQREPGTAHAAIVSSVRFTASSQRAVTAGYDNTVRVWDAADGRLLRVLGTRATGTEAEGADQAGAGQGDPAAGGLAGGAAGGAGAPTGGGGAFGVGGHAGWTAALLGADAGGDWEAPGEALAGGAAEPEPAWLYHGAISGHSDHVQCLCTHGWRECLAASGGKDDAVLFWDVERGEARRRLELGRSPLDLAFGLGAADASLFAALDSVHRESGQVVGYDIETGRRLFIRPSPGPGHVSCIHCAADGATLLAGAAGGSVGQLAARDGAVVFQFETGMPDVNVVSVSCDGRYIQASGDRSETVVLDARWPGRALHRLQHDQVSQHVNGVSAQWCHAARTVLVTGSDDGLMRVWDVALGGDHPMVACLPGHSAPISCIAISPDDDLFASGGDDGKIVAFSTRGSAAGSRYSVGTEQDNFLSTRA